MRPLSVKKSESMVWGKTIDTDCRRYDTALHERLGRTVRPCYAPWLGLRPAGLQPLQSEAGDFARVFQIEFVFDVRSVRFHGLWAEIQ